MQTTGKAVLFSLFVFKTESVSPWVDLLQENACHKISLNEVYGKKTTLFENMKISKRIALLYDWNYVVLSRTLAESFFIM